eukprot:TRINITY_DN4524_c0_g2_i1.p2 TRINITY_DN4524_c0_g2~~TRINITY_DN4524_c0_g2_i1.p2  ORF type:complete len:110 (+),score=4.21 TRINITY_DN4524_c0_g2_i1:449-778(+)
MEVSARERATGVEMPVVAFATTHGQALRHGAGALTQPAQHAMLRMTEWLQNAGRLARVRSGFRSRRVATFARPTDARHIVQRRAARVCACCGRTGGWRRCAPREPWRLS